MFYSIFVLHSLTHSCKFKFPQILFEWASIYADVKVLQVRLQHSLILKRMPRLFLCYLFNYYYTWLCSNTAVLATSYCVVAKNIYSPHPRRALLLKTRSPLEFPFQRVLVIPPTPWNFPLLLNLMGTPWKEYLCQNVVAIYYYYVKDNFFCDKMRKNFFLYVNRVSNYLKDVLISNHRGDTLH